VQCIHSSAVAFVTVHGDVNGDGDGDGDGDGVAQHAGNGRRRSRLWAGSPSSLLDWAVGNWKRLSFFLFSL